MTKKPPAKDESLSATISMVLKRVQDYEGERATRLGKGFEKVTAPIGGALAAVVPDAWVLNILHAADKAAEYTLPADKSPKSFDDIEACEAAALYVQGWAAGLNAASGGATGFWGAAGAAADIPATLTLAACNVRATGAAFGFAGDSEDERAFRLMVLELATRQAGDARRETVTQLRAFAELLNQPKVRVVVDQASNWVAEKIAERVARQLGVSLAGRKLGQVVPVVGGVVAASVNASFQTDVSRAARYAYSLRWLMRQKLLPGYSGEEVTKP